MLGAIAGDIIGSPYDDTIRKAVSLVSDSDTIACIAWSIAEASYNGVPEGIMRETLMRLDENLRKIFDAWCSWMTGGSEKC